MKTTAAKRAEWVPRQVPFAEEDAWVRDLIDDVDAAMGILHDLLTEASEASCDWDFQMLRESVRERCRPFLKEAAT